MLLDLSGRGINGQQAQDALARVNITSNKNPIPFDSPRPAEWLGLRLGTSAGTTRGFGAEQFGLIGEWIADIIDSIPKKEEEQKNLNAVTSHKVAEICSRFPIYQ